MERRKKKIERKRRDAENAEDSVATEKSKTKEREKEEVEEEAEEEAEEEEEEVVLHRASALSRSHVRPYNTRNTCNTDNTCNTCVTHYTPA